MLLAGACSIATVRSDGAERSPLLGQTLEFSAPGLEDDSPIEATGFRGQVLLVDFWASWCEPCKASMPYYKALHTRLADRGFEIVAINVDEDRALGQRFATELALPFPVVWDKGHTIAERYPIPTMPTALLVDREGVIRHVHPGFREGDEGPLEAQLEALLGGALPTR